MILSLRRMIKIKAKIDKKIYELGNTISEKQADKINILEHEINPKWNYTLSEMYQFIFRLPLNGIDEKVYKL